MVDHTLIYAALLSVAAQGHDKVLEETEAPGQPRRLDDDANPQAAVNLLGMLALVVSMFYLINSSHKVVKNNTWAMINSAVSIFVAVLSNDLVKKAANVAFGTEEKGESEGTTLSDVWPSVLVLFLWWVGVVLLLGCNMDSLLHLKGYGTIGGHILGFAAIDLYGNIAWLPNFKETPWMTMADLGIYFATVPLLFLVSRALHMCAQKVHAGSEADDDAWHDQSKDTGTDFFCMGMAFIISMVIRFVITGKLPAIEDEDNTYTGWNTFILFVVGMALLACAGILAKVHSVAAAEELDILSTAVSLTAAFCLIYSAHWHVYGNLGDSLMSHSVVALVCTSGAILFILFFTVAVEHGASKKVLKGMFTGVSLAVGLSWEKTFDSSLDNLRILGATTNATTGEKEPNFMLVNLVSIALVAVVFPAWMVYILPKADDDLQKALSECLAEGPLPLRAFCHAQDLYNGAFDESDDEESTGHAREIGVPG